MSHDSVGRGLARKVWFWALAARAPLTASLQVCADLHPDKTHIDEGAGIS